MARHEKCYIFLLMFYIDRDTPATYPNADYVEDGYCLTIVGQAGYYADVALEVLTISDIIEENDTFKIQDFISASENPVTTAWEITFIEEDTPDGMQFDEFTTYLGVVDSSEWTRDTFITKKQADDFFN